MAVTKRYMSKLDGTRAAIQARCGASRAGALSGRRLCFGARRRCVRVSC